MARHTGKHAELLTSGVTRTTGSAVTGAAGAAKGAVGSSVGVTGAMGSGVTGATGAVPGAVGSSVGVGVGEPPAAAVICAKSM